MLPPSAPPAPAGHLGTDDVADDGGEPDWDVARLEAMNVELAEAMHKSMMLDWRVAEMDNKLGLMNGDPGFANQQSLKRSRYHMAENSSAATSPERANSTAAENFAINTPSPQAPAPQPKPMDWDSMTFSMSPAFRMVAEP